jgi:hypothetical protein
MGPAKYSGGTGIQRNVVDLPGGLGGALTKESETVLYVLDHVQDQSEVEESLLSKRIS